MAAFCLLSSALPAVDWPTGTSDVVLGSDGARLPTGTVTAEADASVRSLAVFPAEEATVTIGGGPLSLQSGAVVSNAGPGKVTLAAAATGTDGVAFVGDEPVRIAYENLKLPANADTELVDGLDLADYEIVSATSVGRDCGEHEMCPHHVFRTNGLYDVQMVFGDGTWSKCVKLRLRQDGTKIVVRPLYSRYVSEPEHGLDNDFDRRFVNSLFISTSGDVNGYGVQALVLRPLAEKRSGTFELASSLTPGGAVTVADGASLAVEGAGAIGDWSSLNAVVDGRLSFARLTDVTDLSLGGTLAGTKGELVFGPFPQLVSENIAFSEFTKADWATVHSATTKMRLDDVTGFADIQIQGVPGRACFIRREPSQIVAYFQGFIKQENHGLGLEGYIMQVSMTIKETAEGLTAQRGQFNYFLWANEADLGTENLEGHNTGNGGTYTINSFNLVCGPRPVRFNLSAANTMTDGSLTIESNACVKVQAAGALPKIGNGRIVVKAGGVLELMVKDAAKGVAQIHVEKGGVLRQGAAVATLDEIGVPVSVEGGTVDFPATRATPSMPDDSGAYLRRLVLQDGARLTGVSPRVAYKGDGSSSTWLVTGSSPSYWESGALFVGISTYWLSLHVDDVTQDDGADLVQTGPIRDYGALGQTPDKYAGNSGPVFKRGDGTWLVDVVNPGFYGRLVVEAGTLALGRSEAFPGLGTNKSPAFTLGGGTLAATAATTNTIKELSLTADSAIDVSSGAALVFGDSSALGWTADRKLVISGLGNGGSVRFGTSASALTAVQQDALRVKTADGRVYHAFLNADGTVGYGRGMMLMVR